MTRYIERQGRNVWISAGVIIVIAIGMALFDFVRG